MKPVDLRYSKVETFSVVMMEEHLATAGVNFINV